LNVSFHPKYTHSIVVYLSFAMKSACLFILLLFLCPGIFAQDCTFDYYNKKGGHYLFSTYYNNDQSIREGVCERTDGTQIYEKRVFQNGHIISEELNHYNDGKFTPRTRTTLNHQAKKGKPIGELKQFNEQGILMIHWEFYKDQNGRRRYKSTEFHINGKLRFIHEYAFIRFSEIDSFNRKDHPPHTVDDFGYSSLIVPYGKHTWYNDKGVLVKEESYDKLSFYDQDAQHLLHGTYTEYHDNGKIRTQGQYKEGNPDGLWTHFHYNGKIYESGSYRDNIKDSLWRQWDDQGRLVKESIYTQRANNPFAPVWEKEYNAAGQLIHSKAIDQKNQGILQDWSTEGKLIRYVVFNNGSQMNWNNTDYRIFEKQWYENGQLKECSQKYSDTAYVSYFRNGQMERLNIAYWKDTVHFSMQKLWNILGTLSSETVGSSSFHTNQQSQRLYYGNGQIKEQTTINNRHQTKERFNHSGDRYELLTYSNNQLNGSVELKDTLSGHSISATYKNGLRHGRFVEKKDKDLVIKDQTYVEGCDNTVQKGNLADLIPKAKQKTWRNRANHILYYKTYQDSTSIKALNQTRDSMAYWLYAFNCYLDSMKYSADYQETEVVRVWLQLPQVYYPKFNEDNNSHPSVKALKALLDSLGYTWKLLGMENGNYEVELMVTDFIHPSMLSFVFKEHWNFVRVQYSRDGEKSNDLRVHLRPVTQRIDIVGMTPCYSEMTFYNEGSNTNFIVYANGDVEIKNRTITWPEWMEYVRNNPQHFPKDFMWND